MGRADKNKHAEPIMTNSAALRVLYDLAGGRMKTWGALGRELGAMLGEEAAAGQAGASLCSLPPVNVDDIYKRNRPWPSGFGPKEYCRAFRKYADEGHASHYGALLKVQQSLEASNAYTPQIKALMENIRPDADDREVAEGLERVMEAIVETARPYNKVGSPAGPVPREDERCGEAGETCSAERQIACGFAAAATRGVDYKPGIDGPVLVAAGHMTGTVAPAARAVGHEPGASANAVLSAQTSPFATGKDCDSRAAMAITSSGEMSLSHIVRLLESCAFGKTGVEILMCVVPARLLGAPALNADLTQACEQGLSPQAQAALAQELCCDSGLACRAMRRSCETLVAGGAIDADRVFFCVNSLFSAPSGYPAGAELSRALSLYTRYADGDAARALLCLILTGLVGISGFNRIMMCPEVGLLFAH
ncbi:MAG: hypothetical protein MR433_09900 [Coriobacteriaceae bacterium]|nr:hypothetical protein [Coriobacteriaceae bacterium]